MSTFIPIQTLLDLMNEKKNLFLDQFLYHSIVLNEIAVKFHLSYDRFLV